MQKIYLTIILLLLFISACAKAPVRTAQIKEVGVPTEKAIEIEKKLKKYTQKTNVIHALLWVELGDGDEERHTDAALVVKRPDSIRADALDQLADVWASVGCDGQKMWLSIPSKSKLYVGAADRKYLYKLAKFDWEITELVSLIIGGVDIGYNGSVLQVGDTKENRFLISGTNVNFWVNPKTGTIVRVVRMSDDGAVKDYEVKFSDFKKIDNFQFPYKVEVVFPIKGSGLNIRYKEVSFGGEVDPDKFLPPAKK